MLADDRAMKENLTPPAECLRSGGLVCFPTETVYGLGGNALDAAAVRAIFAAKGRPSDNPLIVHVASIDAVYSLVTDVPARARSLMERFWPGPLTILLRKGEGLTDVVTAGLDTVGVRMPDHRVALELIRLAGVPVAAPSANTSGRPSPTTSQHVMTDLAGRVDWIVDGGATQVGLESTVIDVTGDIPVILRPGGVTVEELRAVLGRVEVDVGTAGVSSVAPRSPGMKYKHYSPDAEVSVVVGEGVGVYSWMHQRLREMPSKGARVGVLCSAEVADMSTPERLETLCDELICWGPRCDASALAACLYDALRSMDSAGMSFVLVEGVSQLGIGAAVMNRLTRAANHRVTEV